MSVWLRAAELIETGAEEYSCHAIANAAGAGDQSWLTYWKYPQVDRYTLTFSPHGDMDRDAWLSVSKDPEKNKHLRVMALCFAHAVFCGK